MKFLVFIISFLLLPNMFFSQMTYPLNTFPDRIPANSYLKDINNELDVFTGHWVAEYNGKKIYLNVEKEIKRSFKFSNLVNIFYQDALIVKYDVKNENNSILQTNINSVNNNDINFISSFAIKGNVVHMYYRGTNCRVGWGTINLKRLSHNQLSWSYYPNSTTLTTVSCLGNQDTTIYLPETKDLIFTKQ